jgi:hypothetical protein
VSDVRIGAGAVDQVMVVDFEGGDFFAPHYSSIPIRTARHWAVAGGDAMPYASTVRALASLLSLALIVFGGAVAQAEPKPRLEMHRSGVSADDGSGWHSAVSTKGSFSIRLPIPFNDFTSYDDSSKEAVHAIGGKSTEGIKFAAFQLPITAKTPDDLNTIPKSLAANRANKVSDVSRQTQDGADTISFSVATATSGSYFRCIRTKDALYMLSIEFPNAYRETVAVMKDTFFASFKLKGSS